MLIRCAEYPGQCRATECLVTQKPRTPLERGPRSHPENFDDLSTDTTRIMLFTRNYNEHYTQPGTSAEKFIKNCPVLTRWEVG